MEIIIRLSVITLLVIFLFLLLFSAQYYLTHRSFTPAPLISNPANMLVFTSLLGTWIISSILIVLLGTRNFPALATDPFLVWYAVLTGAGLAGLAYAVYGLPVRTRSAFVARHGVPSKAQVSNVVRRKNKFRVFYRTTLNIRASQGVLMKDVYLSQEFHLNDFVAIKHLPWRPDIFELENKEIVVGYE